MAWADGDTLVQGFQWAGLHAWPLYLAWLTLTVAVTAAATCWPRTGPLPNAAPANAAPGPRVGLGLFMLATGAAVFAALASQLGAGLTLDQADLAFAAGLQAQLPAAVLPWFAVLTRLANTSTLTGLGVLVAMLLLLRNRPVLAWLWVLAVGGNGLLNPALKHLYGRARPLAEHAYLLASGYSFPSGHSSAAVVAYGMLACLAQRSLPARWRPAAIGVAVLMIGTVGTSRLFLGVHFASDVLAGFASGTAWLGGCLTVWGLSDRKIATRATAPGP